MNSLSNKLKYSSKLFSSYLTNHPHYLPLISSVPIVYSSSETNDYQLYLYNHYSRSKEMVKINCDIPVTLSNQSANQSLIGTVYVCGPTVYDHCHIGHAMSYIRFDIFRRFLQTYSNVNLVTAMGITDIDEKIMTKAAEEKLSYRSIGDKYFSSFLDDLQSLNIIPVDTFTRVTDHVEEIIDYIGQLEVKGYAYISQETGDVNFDASKVRDFYDKSDSITDKSRGKKTPKDFTLWRSASNDPLWVYRSPVNGQQLPGRPGWHVECSVIASWLFGSSLDFHFGGKDLIFPHHFCESICSSVYFDKIDKQPATKWVSHWYHSSHVKIAREKMSKSLGNIITIKDFLKTNSPDILRIMCSMQHYRSDIEYDNLIIKRYGELDRKFKQFILSMKEKTLSLGLYKFQNDKFINCQPDDHKLSNLLQQSTDAIISGAADDWNLSKGFISILELIDYSDSLVNPTLTDLHCLKSHVNKWMNAVGLSYSKDIQSVNRKQDLLLYHLLKHREEVRFLSLESLKKTNLQVNQAQEQFKKILQSCDNLREKIDSLGYVIKDSKFKAD